MEGFYHSVETGLLGLGFCLGFAAFTLMASPREIAEHLAIELPMLTVTAPAIAH